MLLSVSQNSRSAAPDAPTSKSPTARITSVYYRAFHEIATTCDSCCVEPSTHSGVMNSNYAKGRVRKQHLRWRYETRALYAAQRFRARWLKDAEPSVLDLGAADGRTLLALREALGPGQYDGVEYARDLIDAAPELPDRVKLLQGDVTNLDNLPSGSYDLCTALAVLEHLPDPQAALSEAFRCLKPGGVLVVSCPHPGWDRLAGRAGLVEDEHHEDHIDSVRLESLARASGFAEVDVSPFMSVGIAVLPYLGFWVPPRTALQVDAVIERMPASKWLFVNQGLVAVKPKK